MHIFCPACHKYIHTRRACSCGWSAAGLPPRREPARLATLDQPLLGAPLVVESANPRLIVGYGARGGDAGGVLAIDLATGSEAWHRELRAAVTVTPALAPDGDTVIIAVGNGDLLAVRATDGADLWRSPLHLEDPLEAVPLMPIQRSEPLFIAVLAHGRVASIDWRSGILIRSTKIEAQGPLRCAAPPVRWAQSILIVASENRRGGQSALLTLDAAGGLHEVATVPGMVYTAPIVPPDTTMAILGTNEGALLAIELRTGKTIWSFDAGKSIRATPVFVDGTLYFGSGAHYLFAIDARNGAEQWRFPWNHSINTTPALHNGVLVFADNAGLLVALDLATAGAGNPPRELWRYSLEADRKGAEVFMPTAAVFGGFAVRGQDFYAPSANGALYALPYHGGDLPWAAGQALRNERTLDAAAFTVWADPHKGELPAAAMLEEHLEFAHAATIYQAVGQLTSAARAFERGAETDRLPVHFTSAAALWRELHRYDNEERCHTAAALMANRPLLKLSCQGFSALKVGERSIVRLNLRNGGNARARFVRIELDSADFSPVQPAEFLELTSGDSLSCELSVIPNSAGELRLRVILFAEDDFRNHLPRMEWTEVVRVAGLDAPAVVVQVDKFFNQTATVFEGDAVVISRGPSAIASTTSLLGPADALTSFDDADSR